MCSHIATELATTFLKLANHSFFFSNTLSQGKQTMDDTQKKTRKKSYKKDAHP